MTAHFHLNADELSADLVKSIKMAFKNRTIDITISDSASVDETEYLLSTKANMEELHKSLTQANEGNVHEFTIEEFNIQYGQK